MTAVTLDGTGILGGESVRVAGADAVVDAATVLAVVGAVALVPGLGVQAAVGALGDVGDGQDVRVEEVLLPHTCDVSVLHLDRTGFRKSEKEGEKALTQGR